MSFCWFKDKWKQFEKWLFITEEDVVEEMKQWENEKKD